MKLRRFPSVIVAMVVLFALLAAADESGKTYDLDDPSEPWRTARSGISTKVMSPYTPLLRHSGHVRCWGRSYRLDGIFPSQVTSQEQELFARPIVLMIKVDGEWHEARGKKSNFTLVRDDRIDFSSAARESAVAIDGESRIEYDGLIRTDLKLSSEQPVTLEGLRLVLAFEPDAAIFHHLEMRWAGHIYERSPMDAGDEMVYPWKPLIWVGNHDVGFTVVTETWNGWSCVDNAIRIRREPDALTLSLEIITEPTELGGELRYHIGMMATPAKPMRKDRWDILIGALPSDNLTTTMFGGSVQPRFSFPQPGDFLKTAKMLADNHAAGRRTCYYITTSATSAESQVNKRNHADWVMSKVVLEGDEWKVGSGFIGADACCPASGFADFMAWGVQQAMTHLDFDGIYIDNPGPYWCENQKHGCGVGGKRRYPFFAVRDLHKRIYTIVKSRKLDGIIWEHTSQTFNPLQLAWVDVYSDGEHFRNDQAYPRERLLQEFDRTFMDITGTGHQVGAVPAFLTSMGVRKDGDWAHWLLSRTLPFGQMPCNYHGWLDGSVTIAAARARMDFGLAKETVDFYRPNELPAWFRLSPGDVVACVWQRRRDKAVLAVLGNWQDQPITARLGRSEIKGQLGSLALRDAITGVEIPNPDQYLMFSIPANSFRMIVLESARRER